MAPEQKELTFGQKAVGLSFNPSNDPSVQRIKENAAEFIDFINTAREQSTDPEVKRMLSLAVTHAQEAQMWGVKAVTWSK